MRHQRRRAGNTSILRGKIKHIYIIAAATGLLAACSTSKKATTTEVVKEVTNDIFDNGVDRSIRPKAGPAKEVTIGNYEEYTLQSGNGMKVFVIENHKLPTLSSETFKESIKP